MFPHPSASMLIWNIYSVSPDERWGKHTFSHCKLPLKSQSFTWTPFKVHLHPASQLWGAPGLSRSEQPALPGREVHTLFHFASMNFQGGRSLQASLKLCHCFPSSPPLCLNDNRKSLSQTTHGWSPLYFSDPCCLLAGCLSFPCTNGGRGCLILLAMNSKETLKTTNEAQKA